MRVGLWSDGRVTSGVRFDCPPKVAFDYLLDPRNRPQWQSSLRAVELADDAVPAVGTQWRDLTTIGARPQMRITASDRPRQWAEEGEWRGITAALSLTFEPEGDGTRVIPDLAIHGAGGWRPVAAVLRRLAPAAVKADLARAARWLGPGGA